MMIKEIGRQLKQARTVAGLTQREVAERSGISRENYARIERGAASTTLATFLRIVSELHLRLTLTVED